MYLKMECFKCGDAEAAFKNGYLSGYAQALRKVKSIAIEYGKCDLDDLLHEAQRQDKASYEEFESDLKRHGV